MHLQFPPRAEFLPVSRHARRDSTSVRCRVAFSDSALLANKMMRRQLLAVLFKPGASRQGSPKKSACPAEMPDKACCKLCRAGCYRIVGLGSLLLSLQHARLCRFLPSTSGPVRPFKIRSCLQNKELQFREKCECFERI